MISIEVFAAKDNADPSRRIVLAVPSGCGLHRADTLRLVGNRVVAIGNRSVLALDLPAFDAEAVDLLREAAQVGEVAVGEFTPLGLADSYMLRLEVSGMTADAHVAAR